MNKFLTYAGTQPVYLGDIDFIQNAAGDAFALLARAFMDSADGSLNAILQGVEKTWNSSVVTISPGVVVLDGEILPFEGVTLTSPVAFYFHVESTLSSSRVFEDGNSHQCHSTRKAIINDTAGGGIAVDSVQRLHVPSDDAVYNNASASGFAQSGRLVRKSGLWFMEMLVSVVESSSDVSGVLTFTGIPAGHLASIESLYFAAPTVLSTTGSGLATVAIQPMLCDVGKVDNSVVISLSFSGEQVASGTGACRVLLPMF